MNANRQRYVLCLRWMLSCLLVASVAMAQESVGSSGSASAESLSPTSPVVTGQKAPVAGTFRPAPQADPTRIVKFGISTGS